MNLIQSINFFPQYKSGSLLSSVKCIALLMILVKSVYATQCQKQQCTIIGTDAGEKIIGTNGSDVICGLGGDDIIYGLEGNDLICGGTGNDQLFGQLGDDQLVGGVGDDRLYGGDGDDYLRANQGNDRVFGERGNDELNGGSGNDLLVGGDGVDFCVQEAGADTFQECQREYERTMESSKHPFSVRGVKILDADKKAFTVKGINIFPWHDSSKTVNQISTCWNFNTVRLHSWVLNNQDPNYKDHLVYIDQPVSFKASETQLPLYDIRFLVDYYTSRKIVVIIDIHERLGSFIQEQEFSDYLRFISDVARKFKDNPYVWIDIHNEPGSYEGIWQDFSVWEKETQSAIQQIKSIAPDMVVLVSGTAWGQDSGPTWHFENVVNNQSALLSHPKLFLAFKNVIPTIHFYDQWVFGEQRMKQFLNDIKRTLALPLIVGEYGSFNNINTLQATRDLHRLVDQREFRSVGRIAWHWDALDMNDLTTFQSGGGQYIDSCEQPSNLTELGQLIWHDNHQ